MQQFQLLLQSGVEQYYLVQDTAGGQPVTPCLYFGELLDEEYERFSDLESVSHTRTFDDVGEGFETEPVDVDPRPSATSATPVSPPTSTVPGDFFDRLVDGPDKDYFKEGNLFHDFAEFYVTHPEVVDDAAIDEVVDVMLAEATPYFATSDRPLWGADVPDRPGDHRRVPRRPAAVHGRLPHAVHRVGRERVRHVFRQTRRLADHRALVREPRPRDEGEDRPRQRPDPPAGFQERLEEVPAGRHHERGHRPARGYAPDFQAVMYLCHYRTERPDEPLTFTFFHFLETLDDVVTGDHDVADTLTTVSYYPWTFDEHVSSREAFDVLLDGYNDCVATFEDLGYDDYAAIVEQRSFPETTEKDELRDSSFATEFTNAVVERTSDSVDAEKGCDQAIRALNGVRTKTFFEEDLDALEGFVAERIEELNRYRGGEERFPVEGPGGEPNYRRVDHRDCILEGASDE